MRQSEQFQAELAQFERGERDVDDSGGQRAPRQRHARAVEQCGLQRERGERHAEDECGIDQIAL